MSGLVLSAEQGVAFVSWNLCDNSSARAFYLADMMGEHVALAGWLKAEARDVWLPISSSPIVTAFRAARITDAIEQSLEWARSRRFQAVVVSKPRLPGVLIGLALADFASVPIVLDIDEYEPALVSGPVPEPGRHDWGRLEGHSWTDYLISSCEQFEALTVSNEVLQSRFGGDIVRHARDERRFRRCDTVRRLARERFGYAVKDKVVLFLGTPRRHKGLIALAQALSELVDEKYALCIVGHIVDASLFSELKIFLDRGLRIDFWPNQPVTSVPEVMSIADTVCVIQDDEYAISASQTPAKVTEALAFGLPVIAADTPPLRYFIENGVAIAAQPETLHEQIRWACDQGTSERAMSFFHTELSYSSNRPRLLRAIEKAKDRPSLNAKIFYGELCDLVSQRTDIRVCGR